MKKILSVVVLIFSGLNMACSLHEKKMKLLVTHAKTHNEKYPFAAMIIDDDGNEICRGVNMGAVNPTLHGEIVAINNCVKKHGHENIDWANLTLITTAEPCPMCQGAIIWAGIKKVVYGTSIDTLIRKGWKQIDIASTEVSARSNFVNPEVIGNVLNNQTDPLFVNMGSREKTKKGVR